MERTPMFNFGQRKFFVFLFLFAVAVLAGAYFRSHWPLSALRSTGIADGWRVEKSGSGLAVSWNFDAPLFSNARTVTLEIDDGNEERKIPLDRSVSASTLFYAPHDADVTLRLRIQSARAGEAEKTEVIRLESQKAGTADEVLRGADATPAIPEEGSRSRLESAVSVWRVRALAPPSLTSHLRYDGMDVAVYVKINPSGKVISASTRLYDNTTEAELAKIATHAALQWKFQPLKGKYRNPIYRDFLIRFKFHKT